MEEEYYYKAEVVGVPEYCLTCMKEEAGLYSKENPKPYCWEKDKHPKDKCRKGHPHY